MRGLLGPLAATAISTSVCRRAFGESARKHILTAHLALVCGTTAGHVLIVGWPAFPPSQAIDWQLCLYLGVAFCSCTLLRFKSAACVTLVVAALWILLSPISSYHEWSVSELSLRVTGHAVAFVLLWIALATSLPRNGAMLTRIAILLWCSFASILCILAHAAALSQIVIAFAMCILTQTLMGRGPTSLGPTRAIVPLILTVVGTILLSAYYYGSDDVTVTTYVLIGISPASLWLGSLRWVRSRARWQTWALVLTVLVASGSAAVLFSFPSQSSHSY